MPIHRPEVEQGAQPPVGPGPGHRPEAGPWSGTPWSGRPDGASAYPDRPGSHPDRPGNNPDRPGSGAGLTERPAYGAPENPTGWPGERVPAAPSALYQPGPGPGGSQQTTRLPDPPQLGPTRAGATVPGRAEPPPGYRHPAAGATYGAPPAAGRPPVAGQDRPAPEPPAPPRPAEPATAPAPAGARRSRRGWLALATCLLVLILVGVGVLAAGPSGLFGSRSTGTGAGAGPGSSEPAPSPVLSAAGTDAPEPSQAAVQAALAALLADPALGAHVVIDVVDAASGHQLLGTGATDQVVPASTNKLTTAIAALATRGGAYRIPTRVVAGANPGEVVIIGAGDPTLAAGDAPYYPGAAKLSDLAAQVRTALGGAAPAMVIVDSSLFVGSVMGPGWQQADLDTGQSARITALMTDGGRSNPGRNNARSARPDLAAGQAFGKLLGVAPGAVVPGTAPANSQQVEPGSHGATGSPGTGPQAGSSGPLATVSPGQLLGVVYSPPLLRMIETMLSSSDNTVAEAVARQVALATDAEPSFAGAAGAVTKKLADLGVDTTGVTLVDGSGLSNLNRLTSQLLTGVLTTAAGPGHPELHGLLTGLPVAGYSGTLAGRYRSPAPGNPAAGEIRAKTGTLSGVNALAGVVLDASGRLLAFAVIADQVPVGGAGPAEQALDRVAAALAALT